jgi:hypothetical protein
VLTIARVLDSGMLRDPAVCDLEPRQGDVPELTDHERTRSAPSMNNDDVTPAKLRSSW